MKRRTFNLSFYFSLVIFAIMSVSALLICPMLVFAAHRGYFHKMDIIAAFLILYLASVAVGVAISAIISSRILGPVLRFSSASKKVADGDFSVHVKEDSRIEEISEMAVNFNRMVQELGKTETFRSDFIANLSHEFKTPLASIEGYAMLLRDHAQSCEEQEEYLDRIIHASRRLSTLSGNILKISQLESQEIITDQKQYRLDEQLRQAILFLEADWSKKNLDLQIDLADVIYYGNDELMMQVWLNILSNAVKFTPENGQISVTLTADRKEAKVVIRDTGIGMDAETLRHIFDKFYQGDTSRKSDGNGLGLALVSRIVSLCGGTVSAFSDPGSGSAFTVVLPL